MALFILESKFKEKDVYQFFKKIGILKKERLTINQKQLEQDPNGKLIEHNINLFRKKNNSKKNLINFFPNLFV